MLSLVIVRLYLKMFKIIKLRMVNRMCKEVKRLKDLLKKKFGTLCRAHVKD